MNTRTPCDQSISSQDRGITGQARTNGPALIVGTLAAYGLPVLSLIPQSRVFLIFTRTQMSHPWALRWTWNAVYFAYLLLPIAILAVIITRWERLPLASAGWRRPSLDEIVPAIVAYVFCGWLDFALIHLPGPLFISYAIHSVRARVALAWSRPLWIRIAIVFWAALVEEFGRGYVIERFGTLFSSRLLGGVAALAGSMAMHTAGWGLDNVVVFLPVQLVLVVLYLWRENVSTCVMAHLFVDGMPLVIFPLLPVSVQRELVLLKLA